MTAAKGTSTMSFEYNSDGLRISKTVNGVTTNYIYDADLLVAEYTNTKTIVYIYDAFGSPIGFKCRTSTYDEDVWDMYYYEKNLQGDIVAIYNTSGTKLISYTYNVWGVTTKSYSNGGASTTATYNNLTYRGYYYDSSLSMYYLQSRYYDPVVCRFISPDYPDILTATPMALTDKNLYAYCDNNPVMRVDHDGMFWGTLFDIISLAVSAVDVYNNPDDVWAWIGLAGDFVDLLPIVSGVGEATDALRVATKIDNVVDVADGISDTAKVVDNSIDMANDLSKVGWKLGDDVSNLTKAGNVPSWTTVRQRFWKNEAFKNASQYSTDDLKRMRKGLAPIIGGAPMELHHPFGRFGRNFFIFEPLTKSDHFFIHYGR